VDGVIYRWTGNRMDRLRQIQRQGASHMFGINGYTPSFMATGRMWPETLSTDWIEKK
jgi:hypothetical protein